ncbi:hypothetical protein [uncultured Treponema sp.]|uniref:hypothetical protein n=1 Tax=uncultured Treponema sp. TaxID=162155 RepID=UPI0025E24D2F|nr:hypothetical protein [uncultured Treponema sp.]
MEIALVRYALLCGSAPENFGQKKLEDFHDSLEQTGEYQPGNIVAFPNGVQELFLELALNEAVDKLCAEADEESDVIGKILLYFCARTEADLDSELADSYTPGVQVVRLGNDEVRKDVIEYYQGLCKRCDIDMQVVYDWDGDFVSEKDLGYEKLSDEECREFIAKVKAGYIRIG